MWKRRVKGRKNAEGKDMPLSVMTNGWEIIKNEDILDIIDTIFENEDRIYPRPRFKGSGMFMDEIIKKYVKHMEKK